MLMDSGRSGALCLFENSKIAMKTSERLFKYILREGLSDIIKGKRSRILKLKIGVFEIEQPYVSFLDSFLSE
jgi:hypothetical protein